MTEKETQALAGVASELNAELDSLLEMANDYLSSQKEHRLAPCNPDFLIKHLAINAKRLIEYEKRLLWMADFIANSSNKTVIDVFGECCLVDELVNFLQAIENKESNGVVSRFLLAISAAKSA